MGDVAEAEKPKNPVEKKPVDKEPEEEIVKFSPEEEEALLQESQAAKAEANSLFAAKDYHNALARYDDALNSCPRYLHYPRAVLQSNIAACYLMVEQWKDAIKAASDAIDALVKLEGGKDELLPEGAPSTSGNGDAAKDTPKAAPETTKQPEEEEVDEEVISTGAANAAPAPPPEPASPPKDAPPATPTTPSAADIVRIRTKALLRRARARSSAGGWQNLAGAEEDYRALSQTPGLTPSDARTVRAQLRDLPPRTKAAQEAEMGEMWGKLRTLGDGILKPFGLSTENFQMVKDEKSGGYSMNFNQGGPS